MNGNRSNHGAWLRPWCEVRLVISGENGFNRGVYSKKSCLMKRAVMRSRQSASSPSIQPSAFLLGFYGGDKACPFEPGHVGRVTLAFESINVSMGATFA